MKQVSFLLFSLSLLLVGCSESSKKSSGSNAYIDPYVCAQNPLMPGCQTGGTYTGGTYTGGTYTGGTYTGGTYTGGTAGGSTTGGNNNWQDLYKGGVPSGTCSDPTGSGLDLKKGLITIAGGSMYSPANPWSQVGDAQYKNQNYNHNNSSFLTNVPQASAFLATDARLKVRFKVLPQPQAAGMGTWCFGRNEISTVDYGYTKLKMGVSLAKVRDDGSIDGNYLKTEYIDGDVNGCSKAINFSGLSQSAPNGVVVLIHTVQSNQKCWTGPGSNCTSFGQMSTGACWQVEMQVSVDGTKDIN